MWYINNMLRKQAFAIDEYYHLYNRGVEKGLIFKSVQDYRHFIFLMYICNTEKSIVLRDIGKHFDRGETIIDVGAYCLMPNHFHILAREKIEDGISTYMRKLLTSYSMYFNKRYKRSGRLFENVFKSNLAMDDRYLKYLYSYIHLNPAKLVNKDWRNQTKIEMSRDKLLQYLSSYPYSSLMEYLGDFDSGILNPIRFPGYFLKPKDHKKELFEWLDFTP